MKPRSIVFDLFGDHIRYSGGRARLQALTELMEVFGVLESTTRVVLSRMRREGWFDTSREGRQTVYELTPRAWAMLDRGRARIFDRAHDGWDGNWRMVIYTVPDENRAERDELRKTLQWHGFGPLAAATWVSPHPRLDIVAEELKDLSAARLELLTCQTSGSDADRRMAERCWDLATINAEYVRLLDQLQQEMNVARLKKMSGRDALRARIELVHSYRKLPFLDPDLPSQLLPKGWKGRRAHAHFTRAHDALEPRATEYVNQVVLDPALSERSA